MWEVAVGLRVFVAFVLVQFLIKKVAVQASRTRRLTFQFGLCFTLALLVYLIYEKSPTVSMAMVVLFFLGIVNSLACYCQWRAVAISLSRTSFFTQADDLIAMALGYIFLAEDAFLTPALASGIALCTIAALYYTFRSAATQEHATKGESIFAWILGYSVIWGGAFFAMRYTSLSGVSLPTFLLSWYSGSLLGSLILLFALGKAERGVSIHGRDIVQLLPLAIGIFTAMGLNYWSLSLAPITVVQPIYQVSEMIFPTLIGLYWFGERKQLNRAEVLLFVLGIVGCSVIFFVF